VHDYNPDQLAAFAAAFISRSSGFKPLYAELMIAQRQEEFHG